MKSVIIAFDSLRNPTRCSSVTGGDLRKEFARMKAAKEPLAGLTVVEFWTEDHGCRNDRYIAVEQPEVEPQQTEISQPERKSTKMKSKFLSLLIVGVLALFAMPWNADAQSQIYGAQTLLSAAAQPASTATNRNLVLDVRKQKSVSLQIEVMNDAATSTTLVFPFQRSVDGTTYDSALTSLSLAFAATSKTTVTTNIPTYGAGYIKIPYTTNAHGTVNCTNLSIRYGINSSAP